MNKKYKNALKENKALTIESETIKAKIASKMTKNLLVIGNSISIHPICEYWWGVWGMAASKKENDYAHILANKLSEKNNINLDIINFFVWETNSHDRAEMLSILTPSLKAKEYDYIILQLGENITEFSTLQSDFKELIKYIKSYSPRAKIVVVGNFWANSKCDNAKISAAKDTGISFISLKEFQNEKYYAQIGTKVFGQDNTTHVIEHAGVAKHPNDFAMENIAQKIYSELKNAL